MRIIIAGAGKVGNALTKQLSREGHEIFVIDENPSVWEGEINQYDVMTVTGNCAVMDILREAEGETADLLIACTGSDEINLLTCIVARRINPSVHTIARIRKPEYIRQIYAMKEQLGISMDINPNRTAAHEIFRLIQFPGFLKRETFVKGLVEIVEYKVPAGCILENVPINRLPSVLGLKVLLCTIVRNGKVFIPKGNDIILSGDHIYLTASNQILFQLSEKLGLRTKKIKNVIIVGGGKLCAYLTKRLLNSDVRVKIIEKNKETGLKLAELFPKANIVVADGSSQELLESEGLAKADAFAALTDFDEMNILMSMFATATGVPQVITKINRMNNTAFLENLDIGSIINPEQLSCNAVVRYVRAIENQAGTAIALHCIADDQAEILEFTVDADTHFIGRPLREIQMRKNALIACIIHNQKFIIPDGNTVYHKDDTIIVIGTSDDPILTLNDIFA